MENLAVKKAVALALNDLGKIYLHREHIRNEINEGKCFIGINFTKLDKDQEIMECSLCKKDAPHDSYDLEIETPEDLASLPKLEGLLYLTAIVAIRVDRFLRAKRAMSGRSAETRSRACRKAVRARWEKEKRLKTLL